MTETAKLRARAGWSASARRAFRDNVDANPTIEKATLRTLYPSCDLISEPDNMQAVIDADRYTTLGAQGQMVAHPVVAEVRQYRRAELGSFRAIRLDATGSIRGTSHSGHTRSKLSATTSTCRVPFRGLC